MLLNKCLEVEIFSKIKESVTDWHCFIELLRLLGGGLDNPELDNLTIGSFMQRFGEDIESRSNDGKILQSNKI